MPRGKKLLTPSDKPWAGQAQVRLPSRSTSAPMELLRRLGISILLVLIIAAVVYVDRDAYVDITGGDTISVIDALYYATVSMTTTGYGDIVPVSEHARLVNIIIVTPIRVAFLILLVGTTVEVLANEGRRALLDAQWRKSLRQHTVIIGYGTMGQSAATTLLANGTASSKLLVIDSNPNAVAAANRADIAAIEGDATSRELLHRAEIPKAKEIIITLNSDDTTILTLLTVRQLNRTAHVVTSVRNAENRPLLRQSGADAVITSSDAVGRIMGLASISPNVGSVIEDLLNSGEGFEIGQRMITPQEEGLNPTEIPNERVLAVIRNKTMRRFFEPGADALELGDEIVVIRRSSKKNVEN